MFAVAKILAPVDFSQRSAATAHYAAALACHFHSELNLLYVLEPNIATWGGPDFGLPDPEEIKEARQACAKRDMAAFLPQLPPRTKREIVCGDPAFRIVEYADSLPASLIVLPTHGYGAFRRFILGSVVAKVLHDAACPVLTGVHVTGDQAPQEFGMAKIACAIDLGPDSAHILNWAGQFANDFGAGLTVIHITPVWSPLLPDAVEAGWPADLTQETNGHVERMCQEAGVTADIVVERGSVPEAVCSVAEGIAANLTIIGRGGFGKSVGRLRANAFSIIRQSPCPVISV